MLDYHGRMFYASVIFNVIYKRNALNRSITVHIYIMPLKKVYYSICNAAFKTLYSMIDDYYVKTLIADIFKSIDSTK